MTGLEDPPQITRASEQNGIHLIVLQHGLWGKAANLHMVDVCLRKEADQRGVNVEIFNNPHTDFKETYYGVDACGDILVEAITDYICKRADEGGQVTHLTLIGYSLGGLIVRYVAGKLWAMGWLGQHPAAQSNAALHSDEETKAKNGSPHMAAMRAPAVDTPLWEQGQALARSHGVALPITPLSCVTIATPHLGSWMLPRNRFNRFFNRMVPHVAGRSGTQLMLLDGHAAGRPLLVNLCDPAMPFAAALAAFKHRVLLANVHNDRSVPYCTAAIKLESEYATAHPIPLSPDLPSIVRPSTATASRVTPAPSTYVPPAVTAANGSVTAGAGGVTAGCGAVTAHDEEPDPATPASQAGDVAQPLTGPHKSQPEVAHPKRKVHGRWQRVLMFTLAFTLLLPVSLYMVCYMFWTSRKHARAAAAQHYDHIWVTEWAAATAGSVPSAAPGSSTNPNPQLPSLTLKQLPAADSGAQGGCTQAGGEHNVRVTDADDVHVGGVGAGPGGLAQGGQRSSGSGATGAGPGWMEKEVVGSDGLGGRVEEGVWGEASSGEVGEGDVDVAVDGGPKLHVHEGIVADPSATRDAQVAMAAALNALGWEKIDVDVRHFHAHAAIVQRNVKRFAHCADVLPYLARRLEL